MHASARVAASRLLAGRLGRLRQRAALAVVALLTLSPGLFPRASDIFFLDTPARSLAALTAIIYALAAAHEGCHWLAARAEGVGHAIAVSRRLYFLVFEIDLTRLWSLPRRRRYSALLAGHGVRHVVLLLGCCVARLGERGGLVAARRRRGAVHSPRSRSSRSRRSRRSSGSSPARTSTRSWSTRPVASTSSASTS